MTAPSTSIDRLLGLARRLADIALLVVIVTGLGTVVLGRILPALGHPVFIVAGPSMEPAISLGSVVILSDAEPATLAVADVVTLRSGPTQAVFTHRITRVVEREGGVWIETKGDANEAVDPSLTSADDVIGRVSVSLPAAGYLLSLVSSPIGVIFALSFGGALLVVGWLLDDVIASRRRRRRGLVQTPALRDGRRLVMPPPSAVP